MLQKLSEHIAGCLGRAADADRRAAEASNETMRFDYEQMAKTWRHLANSYQFVESLESFLLDIEKAKGARPSYPPIEAKVFKFPPAGPVFDPDAMALLTAIYNRAIEGQPASDHEIIAKRIIEVAVEGERDPDRLRHGALAQSLHLP